jgi:hypothetical protein
MRVVYEVDEEATRVLHESDITGDRDAIFRVLASLKGGDIIGKWCQHSECLVNYSLYVLNPLGLTPEMRVWRCRKE